MSFGNINWWLLLTSSFALVAHFHFYQAKQKEKAHLETRIQKAFSTKNQLLRTKDELELKIASQQDPAWIEMVLIQELGVVPEGFIKVHFKG